MLQSVNKILPKKVLEYNYSDFEHDFTTGINSAAQANKLTVKVNYMKEKEPQKIKFSYSPVVVYHAPKSHVYSYNDELPDDISALVFAVLYKKESNGNSEVRLVFCGDKYEPYYYRYKKGAKCTLSDELMKVLNILTATAFWGSGTSVAQSKVIGSPAYLSELKERYFRCGFYTGPNLQKNYLAAVEILMDDFNRTLNLDSIPFGYWDAFCNNFNKLICESDVNLPSFNKSVHYFRNKLNRVPKTLRELILDLPRWYLCSVSDSKWHMFGDKGGYNLKFISIDGKYEGVYNLNGDLLDQITGPHNMGTYNYANFRTNPIQHGALDVESFIVYGNVPTVQTIRIPSTASYDNNSDAKIYRAEVEAILKSTFSTK